MSESFRTPGPSLLSPRFEVIEPYRLPGIPQRPVYPNEHLRRLREWQHLRATPAYPELDHVRAGSNSERSLHHLLAFHESTRQGDIYRGKRVPRDAGDARAGRYEIDLVLITPRQIRAIEVKGWSGSLTLQGKDWVQTRRGAGGVINHGDVLSRQSHKLEALRRHLGLHGIDVDGRRLQSAVVLENNHLNVDPAVRELPNVMVPDQLMACHDEWGNPSNLQFVAARIIEFFATRDEARVLVDGSLDMMTPGMFKAAKATIEALRTWDKVTLHGGRQLGGDLLWLQLGSQRLRPVGWPRDFEIAMNWKRHRLKSLLAYVLRQPLGRAGRGPIAGRALSPHDHLLFHEAGQRKPSVIALRDVEWLTMG